MAGSSSDDLGRFVRRIATGLALVGVCGTPVATSLAGKIRAVHPRIDTIEQTMRSADFKVSVPEGFLAGRDLAEDNLRIGHTVIVDSANQVAITRDCWHATAARIAIDLVAIEVACSDKRQRCQRVESRASDVPDLVLPTWRQVLDRRYAPRTTAHVVNTSGCTLEDTASQVEAIVCRSQP